MSVGSVVEGDPDVDTGKPPPRLAGKKSVGWLVAGNTAAAIAQWLYLAMATKIGGVESAGIFAYGIAVCTPIVTFTGLQMRALQASDVSRLFPFATYFSLRLLSLIPAIVLIGIAAAFHLAEPTMALAIVACGTMRLSESISETIYGRLQNQLQFTPIGISLMLRHILSPTVFLVSFLHFRSLPIAIFGAAFTTVAVLLTFDFQLMPSEKWISNDGSSVWKLFVQALPLGGTSMLLSVQANVPRYLLRAFVGDHAVGIYASLAQLPLAASILVRALGDSSSPLLARLYRERAKGSMVYLLVKLLLGVTALFAAGYGVAVLVGPQILQVIYTPEHAGYLYLLFLLIAGEWISQLSSVLGYAATAVRALLQQPAVILLSTTTIVLFGTALTPEAGLEGAAIAVLAGNLVMFLSFAWLIHSRLNDVTT